MKKMVPVYPWPMHSSVADAIEAIDNVYAVEAVPGGPGPILAIRKPPPFMADAIIVHRPEQIPSAVKIITSDGIELVTVRDTITSVFGEGVVEKTKPLTAAQLASINKGVRFQ